MKTFYYEYVEDCIAYLLVSNTPGTLSPSYDNDLLMLLDDFNVYESAEGMYETNFGFDVFALENEAAKRGIILVPSTLLS